MLVASARTTSIFMRASMPCADATPDSMPACTGTRACARDLRADDEISEPMMNGADRQIVALQGAKRALDFGEIFVRADDVAGPEQSIHCRAQNADAVKRHFLGNLRFFARKGERGVVDFQFDVLAHLVLIADSADGQTDLGFAVQGSAFDTFVYRL
jgi:hypothetical protein